ncbi:MAG: PAS domain S-box protein, partial [Chloroflexi bacterium]|nr:PAS domain S-box protein [Chloroflexota bacterium]
MRRPGKSELEATRQTIKFFETLLRASADGIVISDTAQNIVLVNEAFCAFFGQRWQDVVETSLFVWLEQLDGDGLQRWAELERCVRREGVCRDAEFRLTTRKGVKHLNVNCALLEQVADEESGVIIGIWHDVTGRVWAEEALAVEREALQKAHDELEMRVVERTVELAKANKELRAEIAERMRAEKKLAASNEELEDFAYVVSHDLKAPLRGITQLTTWLSTDHAESFDKDGREMLNLLVGRTRRMYNLIEGVLQYSRIGRVVEREKDVDLNLLVQETIESLAPPENVHITVEDALPTVVRERTRVGQVFQNLLGNALKFMDKPEGEICVG